jgi:threonine aldolase
MLSKVTFRASKLVQVSQAGHRLSPTLWPILQHSTNQIALSKYSTMASESTTTWATAGAAATDFRSDVVTTPTARMLSAIAQTTLLDDVYEEDPTTASLESFIADLTGHKAALLVMSGTMGNQVANRVHLSAPPHGVLCDHRAHVSMWEAGGASSLSNAVLVPIVPSNGHHLTLEDVQKHAIIEEDVHLCPTRVICLENTCDGTILPLEEAKRITEWATFHDIRTHLDGARLWEAVAAGAGGLKEYCQLFDSVSLCFSKGLGAPIGSILVGNEKFIKKARWIRKLLGGGVRQAGVLAAPARVAVEDTFLGGKLAAGHQKAKALGQYWERLGGKLHEPVETNMVWVDLEAHHINKADFIAKSAEYGLKVSGGRFVIHYQITDDALDKMKNLLKEFIQSTSK